MKIITYNAHLFEGTVQGFLGGANDRDQERRNSIASRIVASNVDLIGLCEIWADRHIDKLADEIAPKYQKAFPEFPFYQAGSGLAVFSRYQIDGHEDESHAPRFFDFKKLGGPDGLANKGVFAVYVANPEGKDFRVFLSHTQAAYKDNIFSDQRVDNLRTIRDMVNSFNPGVPAIIIGDLNVVGNSEEYQTVLEIFSGFTDAYTTANSGQPGYTYDESTNELAEKFGEGDPPSRFDYILFSTKDWTVTDARVITDWKLADGTDLSDHYPLEAELEQK